MAWAERCVAIFASTPAAIRLDAAAVAVAATHRPAGIAAQRPGSLSLRLPGLLAAAKTARMARSGRPRCSWAVGSAVRGQGGWLLGSPPALGRSGAGRPIRGQCARAQARSVPSWRTVARHTDRDSRRTTAHLHALEPATDRRTHGRGHWQPRLQSRRVAFGRDHRQFQPNSDRDSD